MIGIYLSGTGNTKHCIERLVKLLDQSAKTIPLENRNIISEIKNNDTIILGYPTQFSNAPVMVRDFIKLNDIWGNKRVLCVTTMGAFSGDGAGCTARILKKKGAIILGGLQIHMPDSVCDSKMLKKSIEENRKIIFEADKKIEKAALDIQNGKYPQEGISFFSHIIGLFGQRLWFYNKCIGCGLCSQICPMNNITIENNKAVAGNMCTMCYRCISHCPQKAITLIGKAVQEQCQYDKYIK